MEHSWRNQSKGNSIRATTQEDKGEGGGGIPCPGLQTNDRGNCVDFVKGGSRGNVSLALTTKWECFATVLPDEIVQHLCPTRLASVLYIMCHPECVSNET